MDRAHKDVSDVSGAWRHEEIASRTRQLLVNRTLDGSVYAAADDERASVARNVQGNHAAGSTTTSVE
jgi:hypothetical protein